MVVTSIRSMEHRADIQGLRAVAVLLVIADHAGVGWLGGGFVGVDVFFVISGYLITLLLVREAESAGRVRIGEFYARRARRILPAATLVLVVSMAYAARELSLTRVQQLHNDAVWSALFAANVHFSRLGTDYFASGREPSPFQHYWSLAVEEQFYLLWPLLLAVLVVAVARRGGSPEHLRRALTWLLTGIVVGSLAWSLLSTAAAPVTAFFSSPARAWELAVGALVAVQQPRVAALGRGAADWLFCGGLASVGLAAVAYGPGSAMPGWRALLPVLGAAALLVAGSPTGARLSRLLHVVPLPWLGDLSYSLYLWHWPVLVLGRETAEEQVGSAATPVLLAVTLGASVATYYVVENPLRRGRLLRKGRRGLVLWPVALGAVLLGVTEAERHAATLLHERMAAATGPSTPGDTMGQLGPGDERTARPGPSLPDRLAEALRAADSGAPIPFPLTNLPNVPKNVHRLLVECLAEPPESTTRVCPAGQLDAPRTMVLLGDSQAGQWVPALHLIGQRDGYRVVPLVKLGCAAFYVPMVEEAVRTSGSAPPSVSGRPTTSRSSARTSSSSGPRRCRTATAPSPDSTSTETWAWGSRS